MKPRMFLTVMGLILVLFCYSSAQVPQLINYQGKLTKVSGAPLDTTIQMVFTIYADSNGTSSKWSETQIAVKVEKGVFNVLLGNVLSVPDSVFNGSVRYLGVKVGSDPEITPRKQMVSVPYAFRSGTDGGGGTSGWADDGTVVRLTTGTDFVGIGTTSPAEKLDVVGRIKMTGFKMQTGAIDGYVLTSDVYGEGTWKTAGSGGSINCHDCDTVFALISHNHDAQYVNEGQANSITSGMITDDQIANADISASAAIAPSKISGTAWTSTNDGSGSGLDADLLDGQHASAFLSTANDYGRSGVATDLYEGTSTLTNKYVNEGQANSITSGMITDDQIVNADISASAAIAPSKISGTAWTSTNDGTGSGLDADLLDGQQGTYYTNATNINAGTLADARLSTNVALLNNAQTVTGLKAFNPSSGTVPFTVDATKNGIVTNLNADLLDGQHASAFLSTANDYGRSGVATDLYEGTSTLTDRYVNEGQANSITSGMITDDQIVNADISASANIAPSKISGTAWTSTNDGAASGLDADLLDGQQGTYYTNATNINAGTLADARLSTNVALLNNAQTVSGLKAFNPSSGTVPFTVDATKNGIVTNLNADLLDGQHASAFLSIANDYGRSGVATDLYEGASTLTSKYVNEGQANSITSGMITDDQIVNADISTTANIAPSKISGTAWTSTNDGSGSGLDADLLDGQQGTYYTNASNISAGTLADLRLSANVALLNNAQTLTGLKTFNPSSGTVPFVVDATKNGVVTNLNADLLDGQHASAFADKYWTFRITDTADTTLITKGRWGIARYGNILYGNEDSTHVNLGVSCTTGTSGYNYGFCTVGGGVWNGAKGVYSTVGGGLANYAIGSPSTVAGGYNNWATMQDATVSGGANNAATGRGATIGGGNGNKASQQWATVGGGLEDTASGYYATVPGGLLNKASGDYSFAAGRRAKALHLGSFVWADGTDDDFASTGSGQFLIRASGGVGIGTPDPNTQIDIDGDIALRAGSFTAVTGYNDDISIGKRSFVRITGPTATFMITGIAGGTDGKIVYLYNTTAQEMVILNENSYSSAANRILTMTGTTEGTSGTGNVTLIYDATGQRWIVTAIKP